MGLSNKELGRFLLTLRRGKGLTQKQVFEATGVPISTVSYIESGTSNLEPVDRLSKLAMLYGISLETLLQGGDVKIDEGLLFICKQLKPGQIAQAKRVLSALIEE